jgi:uncharacterized protein DUF6950
MKRRPDWRSRLHEATEALRRAPNIDCGLYVADAILAMTGVDLAAAYRGRYETVEQGVALILADGYADLCAFVAAHLEEVHPSLARAGDVMAFPSGGTGWALGVVNGERVTVWRGLGLGLGTVSRDGAARAFRVPSS